MTAKEVVKKAMFDTYTVEEIKERPRSIMLQDIDADYWNFVIKMEYVDYGKVFYFYASLFVVTRNTYPDVVPLVSLSNVGYSPEEAIEEMANVIERLFNTVG